MDWSSLLYLFYLIGIMISVGVIKDYNLFGGFYYQLSKRIKNQKILLFLYSLIGGVLPIPGRSVVYASLIDTIATTDKSKRGVFGIVGYLSTHHYYFWSPIEATVIIPMAALGVSYFSFLKMMMPMLLTYFVFLIFYLIKHVKPEHIELNIENQNVSLIDVLPLAFGIVALVMGMPPYIIFSIVPVYYVFVTKSFSMRKLGSYVNWKLAGLLGAVLLASSSIKEYITPIIESLNADNMWALPLSLFVGWILAFLMGSSSKFAGLVALFCSAFGVAYLPLFFATEFSAYFLSPMHKCIIISKEYFGTKLVDFYKIAIAMSALIVAAGALTTLFLL